MLLAGVHCNEKMKKWSDVLVGKQKGADTAIARGTQITFLSKENVTCIDGELSSVAMRFHRLRDHFSERRKAYLH